MTGGELPVLEIGGTHVTAALVDLAAGRVLEGSRRRRTLQADAPAEQIIGGIVECAAGLAACPGARWGVAIPGPFDYERGIALFTGVAKFDALHGLDLRRELLDRLPDRPSQVTFLNDAHAFALGEWALGAAAGRSRAVGITLGTGVGSAFLADGATVRSGPEVPPQGLVHLLTHAGRPLEDTVSRRALRRAHAESAGSGHDPRADVHDITELARHGDPVARRVLDDAFRALGTVLAPWLARFEATVLVVGGSVAGSWDLLADPVRAGLRAAGGAAPQVEVVRARHLDDAALLGAAWHTHHDSAATRGPDDLPARPNAADPSEGAE